ncbi:hypothetical protein B484DRAFT_454224 [Ochromonadaceae sp. CCMP2298]|nr:hypothetical protein B484DRAFT_454224 [Ochromonadaceae sp. CCMP2298]
MQTSLPLGVLRGSAVALVLLFLSTATSFTTGFSKVSHNYRRPHQDQYADPALRTAARDFQPQDFDPLVLTDLAFFVERRNRPSHVNLPRKRMEAPFAILLMRASYSVTDSLDFVPMDEFQKDFFLFRQSEWQSYKDAHPLCLQGDLADPVYFDFISFAQYAVIAYKAKYGKWEFVEKTNAAGDSIVVRRNSRVDRNDMLPGVHSQLVGDKVLGFMLEKYPSITPQSLVRPGAVGAKPASGFDSIGDTVVSLEGTSVQPATIPAKASISYDTYREYMQLLLDVFSFNSYALTADIRRLEQKPVVQGSPAVGALFQIVLQVPVNLWSLQVLKQRQDEPRNDFEVKVAEAVARRTGLKFKLISTEVINQINMMHIISVV